MNTRKFGFLSFLLMAILAVVGCVTQETTVITQPFGVGDTTNVVVGPCGAGVVRSVTVSPKTGSGNTGTTLQLKATINCGATAGAWGSSDPTRATVSSTGLVTFGSSAGPVTVCFVLTDNTKLSDCATLTSNGTPAAGQTVTGVTTTTPNITYSTCAAWQDQRFQYTVTTTGGAPTGVKFTLLTNHALASITTDGMVTPKSPAVAGTDSIKIESTFDPSKFVIVTYTVTLCNTQSGGSSFNVSLTVCGQGYTGTTTYQIVTVRSGVTVPNTDVDYFVTDTTVVSVSPSGLISPRSVGTRTVKAAPKATPNDADTYTVMVTNTACQYNLPQGPYALGSGASCTNNSITLTSPVAGTWTSGNTSLATVTSAGVATSVPNASGTVTFTFTPSNGGTPKTVDVVVSNTTCVPPVTTTVTVSPKTLNLFIGQSANLNATVTVSSGSAPTINWVSTLGCVTLSAATGTSTTVNGNKACRDSVVASANGVKDFAIVTVTSGVNSIDYTPPGGTVNVGSTPNLTATCTLNSGMTGCTPYWYSTDPTRVTVVGAPSTIVIAGVSYPAGNTATIKGIFKGTADICVQAAVQDATIKKCYTWTVP